MGSRSWFRPAVPVLVVLLALAAGPAALAKDGPFTILMVVWRGCEDACRGFQDYLRERGIAA